MYTVTMDGKSYRLRVRYNTMERAFELRSGDNEGYMLSGRHERDLLGTGYSYQFSVEPDPRHPEDYDAFYEAISAPVDSHEITMPYGQSTITFQPLDGAGGEFQAHRPSAYPGLKEQV